MPAESWYVFIKLVGLLIFFTTFVKTKSELFVSASVNVFKIRKSLTQM